MSDYVAGVDDCNFVDFDEAHHAAIYPIGFSLSVEKIELDPIMRLPASLGRAMQETYERSESNVVERMWGPAGFPAGGHVTEEGVGNGEGKAEKGCGAAPADRAARGRE